MKLRNFYLFLALVGMFVLAACGNGETEESAEADTESSDGGEAETYEFRLGHIAPDDHIWNEGAKKLAEELEERSDGRMTMELYPGGQLGNDADMIQQIQSGSLDFGLITNAHLTTESDAFSAWFAPFLFDSYEAALEASNTELGEEILATLDGQGVKAMDYMFSGHRTMMFSEKIETPEDIAGLTLRVTPSPALEDWYRMLGASPESIPLPDVYQSAQTGVIDGMEMDLDAAVTSNFNEVTGYGAMTNHMVWPSVMVMNEDLYGNMSEEDQKIVVESMAAASEYGTMERAGMEQEYIDTLTERGMELYEMEDGAFDSYIEEFDEKYRALDPLIDEFIGEFR